VRPAAALLLIAIGCAGRFDVDDLVRRNPGLDESDARVLAQATPYLLPERGELVGFLCRWPTPTTLAVSLPRDASERERSLLERALRAWEQAALGVDFEIAERGPVDIGIRFGQRSAAHSGTAAVDCAVAGDARGGIEARLVSARVVLRRADVDWRGRVLELRDEEVVGAALHEIGHALGFQGHALRGVTVMTRSVDHVRESGAGVLAGRAFSDPALRALYALPSGEVVARWPLPLGATEPVDRTRNRARQDGWTGPLVRVGDREARIDWLTGEAGRIGYRIPALGRVLEDPAVFSLAPDPALADTGAR
jgi:hypothetical protein